MLSERDKQDYKEGMFELYSEVGTTNILYHELQPPQTTPDIYKERKKVYNPPMSLVGVIAPLQPTEDPIMFANNKDKQLFKFDIIGLSLENNNLDPYEMTKGLFEFDEVKYSILKVTPKGQFTDFYTSYEFIGELIR